MRLTALLVIVHGLPANARSRAQTSASLRCLGVEADDGCRPRSSGNGYVASHGRCSFQRTQRQGSMPPPLAPVLLVPLSASVNKSAASIAIVSALPAGRRFRRLRSETDFDFTVSSVTFHHRKQFFQQRRELQLGEKLPQVAMSGTPANCRLRSRITGTFTVDGCHSFSKEHYLDCSATIRGRSSFSTTQRRDRAPALTGTGSLIPTELRS